MLLTINHHRLLASTIFLVLLLPIGASANGPDDFGNTPEQQLQALGLDTSPASLHDIALNRTNDSDTRYLAAVALGRSKSQDASSTLVLLLSDPDADIRVGAAIGLRSLADIETTSTLIEVFNLDSYEVVQQVALTALEAIGAESAVEALLVAAGNPNRSEQIRLNSLDAIKRLEVTGRLDYEAVKGQLQPLLTDSNPNIRSMAAHAMAAGGDRSAIPTLALSALNESVHDWIKSRSVRDLQRLTNEDFGYFKKGGGPASQSDRSVALGKIENWWAEQRSNFEMTGDEDLDNQGINAGEPQ